MKVAEKNIVLNEITQAWKYKCCVFSYLWVLVSESLGATVYNLE